MSAAEPTKAAEERPPHSQLPGFAENLILVVGIGRSGTTALHKALGHHPAIIDAPSEAPLERAIAAGHGRMITRPDKFTTYVKKQTKVPWDHVRRTYRQLIFEAAFGAPVGRPLLDRRAAHRNDLDSAHRWAAKVGGISNKGLLGFGDLFADFRTIYIHRSGIDTVASRTKFHGFSSNSFRANCETWALTVKDMRTCENNSDTTVVRHADLLSRPEEMFETVFAGLGLPSDPAPAAHCRSSVTHPTQAIDESTSVEAQFNARDAAYEQWTDEEQQIFIEVCGPAMATLGYAVPFA